MYHQQYVNTFLGQDLTPHCMHEVMVVAVAVDGTEAACAPIIDWLLATCTHVQLVLATGATSIALPLGRLSPPTAPITNEYLLKHQWAFIALDLLVLDPSQLQHGLSIPTSFGKLAKETCLLQEEAIQVRGVQENQTIEHCFQLNTIYILQYCQVQM